MTKLLKKTFQSKLEDTVVETTIRPIASFVEQMSKSITPKHVSKIKFLFILYRLIVNSHGSTDFDVEGSFQIKTSNTYGFLYEDTFVLSSSDSYRHIDSWLLDNQIRTSTDDGITWSDVACKHNHILVVKVTKTQQTTNITLYAMSHVHAEEVKAAIIDALQLMSQKKPIEHKEENDILAGKCIWYTMFIVVMIAAILLITII